MTVPTNRESTQPLGEDRDKPIPVSERYRKSFIATLTWSSFAILIAGGSIGQGKIVLPLTQMKYPTSIAVIVSFGLAVFWFCHFRRSERLLKLSSSEFVFGLSASSLAEALEEFRQKVTSKSGEIGMMKGVKQPDLSDGRMALQESENLLTDLLRHLISSTINEFGGNIKYAIRTNNKELENSSSEPLVESIDFLIKDIEDKKNEISINIKKQAELVKIWMEHEDVIYDAGRAAFENMEIETKAVTEAAKKLNETSSQISKRDAKDMRTLEYWPARLMLSFAFVAAAFNLGSGLTTHQVSDCRSGKPTTLCAPVGQVPPLPGIDIRCASSISPKARTFARHLVMHLLMPSGIL